jgi:hypothetical protein
MGVLILLLEAALVGLVSRAIYLLYFHPLAKVPGRKLAALSRLYEFYWDCIKPGRYSFEMREMHERYGKS